MIPDGMLWNEARLGLVARAPGIGSGIRPFGTMSYAPEPQPLSDRSESGHSVAAVIVSELSKLGDKVQQVTIPMTVDGMGRAKSD